MYLHAPSPMVSPSCQVHQAHLNQFFSPSSRLHIQVSYWIVTSKAAPKGVMEEAIVGKCFSPSIWIMLRVSFHVHCFNLSFLYLWCHFCVWLVVCTDGYRLDSSIHIPVPISLMSSLELVYLFAYSPCSISPLAFYFPDFASHVLLDARQFVRHILQLTTSSCHIISTLLFNSALATLYPPSLQLVPTPKTGNGSKYRKEKQWRVWFEYSNPLDSPLCVYF
jgi:hypothetical protein